ncbi:hypothetical protein DOY81_009270 [Sarcophaga bullata]|nr:hypothetical protein DOY81_009270 [Sarcophaga bullata]
MEYALPELLSRNDILRILNERQLQVNNMDVLTHEELLRVYKTFVMPLSQRPERSKRIKQHQVNSSINKAEDYEGEMQVEPFESSRCSSA